jgi:hypothetical protein
MVLEASKGILTDIALSFMFPFIKKGINQREHTSVHVAKLGKKRENPLSRLHKRTNHA